ncbi:uncharacterized protein BJ212DRAFT_1296430 [Suillus subaureus]|uniref:Uncharacterized protein n=1 Tax=Suillus subaureus TaxID=48587 RepID=A0A9P7EJV1_9AGAM|nr:uncharacterized protein BJ212DRAFT_1296430 [Suillus subaureus]KAG1823914.1 hypothetical protein BJ212DRAFT_1296430 [Suillus subaureus]
MPQQQTPQNNTAFNNAACHQIYYVTGNKPGTIQQPQGQPPTQEERDVMRTRINELPHQMHLKFLHMVLEDEGETYANASLESLCTLVTKLTRSSKKEVEDSIGFGVTAYSHNVTSFAVGDAQLVTYLDSSDNVSSGDSSEDSNGGQDPKSWGFLQQV